MNSYEWGDQIVLNFLSDENNFRCHPAFGRWAFVILALLVTSPGIEALAAPICETLLQTATSGPIPDWQSADPYRVLDVPRTATFEQVRSAYRKLAMIYHPDHYDDSELGLKIMQSLNSALAKIKKGGPLPKDEPTTASRESTPESKAKNPWQNASPPRRQAWTKEYQAGQENREQGIVLAFARVEKKLMAEGPMTRADSIIKAVSLALEIGSGWTREEVAIYLFHSYGRFATGQPTPKQLLFYSQLLRATDRFYQNPKKPDVENLIAFLLKDQSVKGP